MVSLFFCYLQTTNYLTTMKFLIFTALFIASFSSAFTQNLKNDVIATEKGNLTIHPILHSTMVLEWNDLTVYTDPYGGSSSFNGITTPDLVLITDIHGDHMNIETLEALNLYETFIVTCQAVADKLPDAFKNVSVLNNGDKTTWNEIEIEAIPMYNMPEDEESRHTKGRGNGYVITLGGKRVYISGDTEDIPEMRALKNIDAAFVCMNLPYTMDVDAAADAVLEFTPKVVYPFHYRGGGGKFSDVNKFKALVNDRNSNIEVKLLEWYPKKD